MMGTKTVFLFICGYTGMSVALFLLCKKLKWRLAIYSMTMNAMLSALHYQYNIALLLTSI